MSPIVEYGRARAINPGKYGDKDWRVEFNGVAPSVAELLFMLGMVFLAEDRYLERTPWANGRYFPWQFIKGDGLLSAYSPEAVLAVCREAEASVENGRGFRR